MISYRSIALKISTVFQQTCSFSTTHGSITQLIGDRSVIKISGDNVLNFLQVTHTIIPSCSQKFPPLALPMINSTTDILTHTHTHNLSQQTYRAFSPMTSLLYHLPCHPPYIPAFSMLKAGISMTCSSTNTNPCPPIT